MKQFNCNVKNEIIPHEYKKDFFFGGFRYVIHRPIYKYMNTETITISDKRWTVSNYATGKKCAPVYDTITEAEEQTITILLQIGEERLKEILSTHPILNEEKNV